MLFAISGSLQAREKPEWRNWPTGDRLNVSVGAFFANLDTKVRLDASEFAIGTAIDFESDLGLEETKTRPIFDLRWRFAKRHVLDFTYFNLDRSGEQINTVTIRFGETVFEPNLQVPLESFLDIEVFEVAYKYSVIHDARKDWSIGLGLSAQDLKAGIRLNTPNEDEIVREEGDFVAPLPTFGTSFTYAFNDKWLLDLSLGWLDVKIDIGSKEFDGGITDVSGGVRWKAFRNVGFGVAYLYFDVNVDVEDSDWLGFVKYKYYGPLLYLNGYY